MKEDLSLLAKLDDSLMHSDMREALAKKFPQGFTRTEMLRWLSWHPKGLKWWWNWVYVQLDHLAHIEPESDLNYVFGWFDNAARPAIAHNATLPENEQHPEDDVYRMASRKKLRSLADQLSAGESTT